MRLYSVMTVTRMQKLLSVSVCVYKPNITSQSLSSHVYGPLALLNNLFCMMDVVVFNTPVLFFNIVHECVLLAIKCGCCDQVFAWMTQ